MKTILLWDPRFPDRRPARLTVEDTVASAAVRAGVAAAANPAEAGALSAGGALDPTMLTEVVLQHGNGGATRRVFLPYSVVIIGALAGVLAAIGTPIASGLPPITITPPVSNLRQFKMLGSNLDSASLLDYGTGYPVLDRMKTSRFTKYAGSGSSGYDALAPGDMDANGYPIIPCRWLINVEGQFGPAGMPKRYVVRTKLDTAVFQLVAATLVSDTPAGGGKPRTLIVDTTNAKLDTGYRFEILSDTPFNDVNWVTCVREDQVALFDSGEIFNPDFVNSMSPWGQLRFMDWLGTNDTTQTNWASRPTLTSARYKFAPLELCIDFANKTGLDAWYNVPHTADDDFIRRMAMLIKSRQRTDTRINIEYSNEVWNDGFQQTGWCNNQPRIINGTYQAWGFAGYRAAQVAAIFRDVFEGDNRLVNHIGHQQGRTQVRIDKMKGVVEAIREWSDTSSAEYNATFASRYKEPSDLFDMLCITTYVSGDVHTINNAPNRPIVEGWADAADDSGFAAAFRQLRTGSEFSTSDCLAKLVDPAAENSFANNLAFAASWGLGLSGYEGGSHVNPPAWQVNPDTATPAQIARMNKMVAFFTALNSDARMGALLKDVHDAAFAAGMTMATHFTNVTRWGIYGMWGLKEYLYAPANPRFTAMTTYNQGAVVVPEFKISASTLGQFYVGADPKTTIKIEGGLGIVRVSSTATPAGRTLRGRKASGTLTAIGKVDTVFTATDESVPPKQVSLTLTQDVKAAPAGKRYLRMRAIGGVSGGTYSAGGLPSLTSTDFMDGATRISTSGWTMLGDQYDSNENLYNLIDGNDATIWTGKANQENAVIYDAGAGVAVQPTSIRMRNRSDIPGRAPANFVWEWSDDKVNWTQIFATTAATYTNNVFSAVMNYNTLPTVTLSAAQSKAEGNSGATVFTYTVTRSSTSGAVNVVWSLAPGATSADDYTDGTIPAGGVLAFADGQSTGTITISLNGDTIVEPDEAFTVSVLAPSGYAAGAAMSATGTVLNDDTAPNTSAGYQRYRWTIYNVGSKSDNSPLTTNGIPPSNSEWQFLDSNDTVMPFPAGTTVVGDQFNTGEPTSALIDGTTSTFWTGKPNQTNVLVLDLGDGNLLKPAKMRWYDRADITQRAAGDFMMEAEINGVWTQICRTVTPYPTVNGNPNTTSPNNAVYNPSAFGGAYTNHMLTAPMTYSTS